MTTDATPQPDNKPPESQVPTTEAAPDTGTETPVVSTDAPTPSVAEMMQATGQPSEAPAASVEAQPATPEAPAAPVEAQSTPPEVPTATEAVPVAETPAASPAEPAEASVAETPAPVAPASTAPPAAANVDSETVAARIKEKLGHGDAAAQSSLDRGPRPELPPSGPVEIPVADDLDADLEAEISSVMQSDEAPPVTEAPASESGSGDEAPEEFGPGSRVSGVVQHIHGDDVFVNAGLVADVIASLKQFPEGKLPEEGQKLDLVVESIDGDGLVRARLPEAKTKAGGNWDALSVGQVVDCQVNSTNKGGLQVTVSNLKGFLPASQVDLGYVASLDEYVGQKLTVQLTEVNPRKRNLVVSRKALLLAERESAQEGLWESLEVGQDMTGTVKTLKNYGAFVNLGPIDGFLHIGEISWSRIAHPNEVLKEGQTISVRILKIDREKNRISLGMKQQIQNPWENLTEKYPAERIVNGRVSRIADFGAFVELEPGVEGLVHISELAWRRVGSVSEVLSVDDVKEFQVLEVNAKRKRVSLSLKALEKKPESARRHEEEDQQDRPVRKPNLDLRGGMGGNSGAGGLFGNPNDFT